MSSVHPNPSSPYPPPGSQPPPPLYQPPPPGSQPSPFTYQPPGNTTVVVAQPTVLPGSACPYRQVPCQIECQFCRTVVLTTTQFSVGTFAWLVGGLICLVGCYLGCCLIPCCVDGCKDVIHTCPNCKATVGRYNRL